MRELDPEASFIYSSSGDLLKESDFLKKACVLKAKSLFDGPAVGNKKFSLVLWLYEN